MTNEGHSGSKSTAFPHISTARFLAVPVRRLQRDEGILDHRLGAYEGGEASQNKYQYAIFPEGPNVRQNFVEVDFVARHLEGGLGWLGCQD